MTEELSRRELLRKQASALQLNSVWTWYAHPHSGSGNYAKSYFAIGECRTVEDFWSYFNNISAKDLYTNRMSCNGFPITAFSFFRDGVPPEWEHERNQSGGEWGCREDMTDEQFAATWKELAVAAVGEQFHNCVGIRMVNKSKVGRTLFKLEVWMDSIDVIRETRAVMRRILSETLQFSYLPHSQKCRQASDYTHRRYSEAETAATPTTPTPPEPSAPTPYPKARAPRTH